MNDEVGEADEVTVIPIEQVLLPILSLSHTASDARDWSAGFYWRDTIFDLYSDLLVGSVLFS